MMGSVIGMEVHVQYWRCGLHAGLGSCHHVIPYEEDQCAVATSDASFVFFRCAEGTCCADVVKDWNNGSCTGHAVLHVASNSAACYC